MNVILFDSSYRNHLLPLTYTRPVADLRVGILTIQEKWNLLLNTQCSFLTEDYLQTKYPAVIKEDNWLINASLLPNELLKEELLNLNNKEALTLENDLLAIRLNEEDLKMFFTGQLESYTNKEIDFSIDMIQHLWDIFDKNGEEIEVDYELLTQGKESATCNSSVQMINEKHIFIEEGAKLSCCVINASEGPVYIGKNAEVMEGALIRGPFALCDNSTVKMGAKIYGSTTIGPYCKVGGELNNVVFWGYANKAHDGFLGQSVIGQWCNLGADTNNSNLKNNYEPVRLWDYVSEHFEPTGLQFCGLIMGDHSKSAINTMFNTGTVVGVACNIFGAGFPRNHVASFSWGGVGTSQLYQFKKVKEVAERVFERRNMVFDEVEENILINVFEQTKEHRR